MKKRNWAPTSWPSPWKAPARLIAHNAGVEGDVIIEKLIGTPFEQGYNAMADRIENLIEAGVLDPAKVTRSGLTNACGIAGIMLTTQAVMVEKPKPKTGGSGGGGGQAGGYTPSGMPAGMTI